MRRIRPRGTTAATLLLLLFPACTSPDRGSSGPAGPSFTPASEPPAPPAPTSSSRSTVPAIDYRRGSRPVQIATGLLVETSLDGSAAFVAAEDDRFGAPGCEGQPEPVLFRQPLEGGPRQLLGDGKVPLGGELIRAGAGKVALVKGCEGFFSGLLTGTETDDGGLGNMRPLSLVYPDDGLASPNSFAWSADGSRLLAGPEQDVAGGGSPGLLEVDPATGVVRRLFDVIGRGGIAQVGQVASGAYLVAAGGKVTFHDERGTVKETYEGNGFSVAPDGRQVAVFGKGLTVVPADGVSPSAFITIPVGRQITSAAFSPDGRALACINADTGPDNQLWVVRPEDRTVTTVAGPGPLGRAFFSGDGRRLLFNEFGGAPDFRSKLLAISFG